MVLQESLDPVAWPNQERICTVVGGFWRITLPMTPHCPLIGHRNMHDLRLFYACSAGLDALLQRAQIVGSLMISIISP